jgi:3-oxoacyl-[acyl-carrier protein] reductase
MNFNLRGKTAIVGGSSKGLGKACAIALAREGVNVTICARNVDALHETQKEIEALGVGVLALNADMSSADDNRRIVDETVKKFGTIDILVNNSGGPKPGTFCEISEDDLDEAYQSVLKYNIRMINLCLPYMERSGGDACEYCFHKCKRADGEYGFIEYFSFGRCELCQNH